MFEKFSIAAALFAAQAIADVEPHCCKAYSGEFFTEDQVTLCVSDQEGDSKFTQELSSLESISSFECGSGIEYKFCT